jgi:hypothetical protein
VPNRTFRRFVPPVIAATAIAATALAATSLAAGAGSAVRQSPVPAVGSIGWRITDALPSGVQVSSVVATSRSSAWAVGCCSNRSAKNGIRLWHWNGARWLAVSVPPGLGRQARSTTIAASPDGSAWVFGVAGGTSDEQPFVLHWTGRDWAATDSGTWDAGYTAAATAPNAHDAWSFGWDDGGPPVNAHFNGTTWSAARLPMAVQQASALSASNIWAVGAASTAPETAAVMRWNGTSWNAVRLPVLQLPPGDVLGQLNQVSAVAPDSVWVAAELRSGSIENLYSGVLLLHWNGSGWQQLALPRGLITGQFDGVSMSPDGSGGLWLTTVPWGGSKEVVLHYSDGQWRRAAAPPGLSSVAWIPGTASVWAAASGGIAKYGP